MKIIDNLSDNDLKLLKNFRDPQNDSFDEIICDGKITFKKLIQEKRVIERIYCSKVIFDEFIQRYSESLVNTHVFILTKSELKEIRGESFHQQIFSITKAPRCVSLSELQGPSIYLYDVKSPENVGSIIRSCAIFGMKNIIFHPHSCSPFQRRCVRVSMGHFFDLNYIELADPLELKNYGQQLIALEQSPRSTPLKNFTFPNNFTLILGSEGTGITSSLLEKCDYVLEITTKKDDSLNVSHAASLALYEWAN